MNKQLNNNWSRTNIKRKAKNSISKQTNQDLKGDCIVLQETVEALSNRTKKTLPPSMDKVSQIFKKTSNRKIGSDPIYNQDYSEKIFVGDT